jgi:phage terminase large subunit
LTLRITPIPAMLPLWRSDKRYRIAKGGRGSGKSYGIAQRFVTYALKRPCRLLCTRDVQNTLTDSALAILKRVIRDNKLDAAFEQTVHGLRCRNGSEFIFRGLQNPDRIKSLEGVQYVWCEEAHRITRDAWNILIPTIREPDSEIWASYNPDTVEDPIRAYEGRPDAEVVIVNYQHNPFFPDVLRKEMQYDRETDYDKYRWIWEGEPRRVTDAQVFRHKYRVAAFDTPPDVQRFYYGADWGFSQDPTTLVRCFIKNQVLWIDYEAYGVGVDIDEIGDLFTSVPGAERWPIVGDSERPDTMSYLRKQGFNVHGAKKGKGSVEEGIQFIRSFRGVVIHERCKHTADEFKLYSYKTDKLTGEVLPVLEDKHNHCIDAVRYALERTMRVTKVAHMGAA